MNFVTNNKGKILLTTLALSFLISIENWISTVVVISIVLLVFLLDEFIPEKEWKQPRLEEKMNTRENLIITIKRDLEDRFDCLDEIVTFPGYSYAKIKRIFPGEIIVTMGKQSGEEEVYIVQVNRIV